MGIDLIIALAHKYIPQIIGAVAVIALYFYWHHQIYQSGVDDTAAKYEKRDADTARKSAELMEKRNAEIAAKTKLQDKNFTGAVIHYAKTIENLNSQLIAANNRSLRINTKAASCDRNAMRGKGEIPQEDHGAGGEIYSGTELADENRKRLDRTAYEIDIGAAACREMAEFVKREFELR